MISNLLLLLFAFSLVSCSAEYSVKDPDKKFAIWFDNFNSLRYGREDLDDFVESYEVIWANIDNGPNLPMKNAAGIDEFKKSLAWFDTTVGISTGIQIKEVKYIKNAYSMGYKNVYSILLLNNRVEGETLERYLVFDEAGKLKLLRIYFENCESLSPGKCPK